MKRLLIWSTLGLIVAAVAIVALRADNAPWRRSCGPGWRHHTPFAFLAHELKLSGPQQSQIKSLWTTERPVIGSLVQEFVAETKEMDAATSKRTQDEAKVQSIATRQGETVARLLIEKERFKSMVYTTVLNQEQRDKADELQKTLHARFERFAAHIADGSDSPTHQ